MKGSRAPLLVPLLACLLATSAPTRAAEPAKPAPPSAAPPAAADGVSALFAAFQKSPGLASRFREAKHIALLAAPLKSEGVLYFERRHGLARHTLQPSPNSVLLTDQALSFWDGKQSESVSLRSAPGLKVFADSFRMILAADREGLEKHFAMSFAGDANANWKLTLSPRDASLKKAITSIELSGTKLSFANLTVFEGSGDKTVTEFFETDTQKKFTAAEAQKLFRVPPQLP